MIDSVALGIWWICAGSVGYAYLCYPILIWCSSKLCGRESPVRRFLPDELPSVTVLAVAHNEEQVIVDRIRNLLCLDYAADRLQIIIASDGSTDATNDLIRPFRSSRLHLIEFSQRRGKTAVLNSLVPACDSDYVVLTDANTRFANDAVQRLVENFEDDVGVVCGQLILLDDDGSANLDGQYWRVENFLKQCESRLGALLGANGAIYSLRRKQFVPLPNGFLVDDFAIPLRMKLCHGCQIRFAPNALAYERTPPRISDEFQRRRRIGNGAWQCLSVLWGMANPRHGWMALSFVSHKVMRWFGPFFLIGAFLANLLLLDRPFYWYTAMGQAAFYGLAVAGMFLPGTAGISKLIRMTTMFAGMNLALLTGFIQFWSPRSTGTWERTARR